MHTVAARSAPSTVSRDLYPRPLVIRGICVECRVAPCRCAGPVAFVRLVELYASRHPPGAQHAAGPTIRREGHPTNTLSRSPRRTRDDPTRLPVSRRGTAGGQALPPPCWRGRGVANATHLPVLGDPRTHTRRSEDAPFELERQLVSLGGQLLHLLHRSQYLVLLTNPERRLGSLCLQRRDSLLRRLHDARCETRNIHVSAHGAIRGNDSHAHSSCAAHARLMRRSCRVRAHVGSELMRAPAGARPTLVGQPLGTRTCARWRLSSSCRWASRSSVS